MLSPALRTILGEISGVLLIAFVVLAALEVSGKRIGSGAVKDGDDEDENLSPEARAIRKRYLQAKAKQAAKDAPLDDETLERMCKAACHDETPDDATLQRMCMAASEDADTKAPDAKAALRHLVRKRKREFPEPAAIRARQMRFIRRTAHKIINLGLIITSALMIWKSLMVLTHTESPVVVVLSGSMEPGFWRGDILFLWHGLLGIDSAPFRVGEVILFKNQGHDVPIIHRVVKVHEKHDGSIDVLTKGDNNVDDDRGIYPPGQRWLNKTLIIGRAVGYLPYVGYVTLVMNDYPVFKYLLIGLLGLFSVQSGKQ